MEAVDTGTITIIGVNQFGQRSTQQDLDILTDEMRSNSVGDRTVGPHEQERLEEPTH